MGKSIRSNFKRSRKFNLIWLTLCVIACSSNDGPRGVAPGALPLGGACYTSYDCGTGFCCTSPPCRGGMCTYACRSDIDCPYGTRCDGGACFVMCYYDTDCAWGQTCKKGRTLCQY